MKQIKIQDLEECVPINEELPFAHNRGAVEMISMVCRNEAKEIWVSLKNSRRQSRCKA